MHIVDCTIYDGSSSEVEDPRPSIISRTFQTNTGRYPSEAEMRVILAELSYFESRIVELEREPSRENLALARQHRAYRAYLISDPAQLFGH